MKNNETKIFGEITVTYDCKITNANGKDVTLEYRKYSDNVSHTQWEDGFTVSGEEEDIAFDILDNNDIHDHKVEVKITACEVDVNVMRKVGSFQGGRVTAHESVRTEKLDLMINRNGGN